MPQDNESSKNTSEEPKNIIHGSDPIQDPHVDRADKTAEMPEYEKGAGLEGMNASGGQSQGLAQGPDRGQGGRKNK